MTDLQNVLPLLALIPEPLKIGHFTFHARGPLQKALANGKLDKADLPFAPELLPDEPIPVAGKLLPVKAMLMAVLADGKFGPDDLLRVLAAWSGAPDAPKPIEPPPPVVITPPVIAPPVILPQPSALLYPSQLQVNLDLFLGGEDNPGNPPAPYKIELRPDGDFDVVKTDGTTNMPIHGGAYLHAAYCNAAGVPFRFEDQLPPALHLYGTARWVAEEVARQGQRARTSMLTSVNGAYGQVDGPGGRIVNWNDEAETPTHARKTGGMDVPMHFPPEANDCVVRVRLEVDTPSGLVASRWIYFPKAS